jgi:hypothetical protein
MTIHQSLRKGLLVKGVMMCLGKRSDTVGEPISTLYGQPFCIGTSMVLCPQRRHRRGSIFDSAEFANSIRSFCETYF